MTITFDLRGVFTSDHLRFFFFFCIESIELLIFIQLVTHAEIFTPTAICILNTHLSLIAAAAAAAAAAGANCHPVVGLRARLRGCSAWLPSGIINYMLLNVKYMLLSVT